MKEGIIERGDFGTIVELVQGPALITAYHRQGYRPHELPDKKDMIMIIRYEDEIHVMHCDRRLEDTGTKRNHKPVMKYTGKIHAIYDTDDRFSLLDMALRHARQ